MLERHVNWHFKQSESPSNNGSAPRRSLDTPPNRLIKRCGKKLRYRRQPWSGMYWYQSALAIYLAIKLFHQTMLFFKPK